ncbi:hypothetical protein D3C75_884210 [compost metagenome]
MQDLAFCDQILDSAGYIFNRHVGIDTMLVIEIDTICLQSLERFLDHLFDVLRAAVKTDGAIDGETELAGDLHLVTKRLEGFAHQLFVGIGAVHFRCVEEGDSFVERRLKRLDTLTNISRWTVVGADAHAP